jgi:hypothetical protein
MPKTFKIPPALMAEFLNNVRKPGGHGGGTMPADINALKQAITTTLASPAFMERLVNHAMKQAEFKMK